MSAQTKADLETALAAHLADECSSAILGPYVVMCAGQVVARIEANETTMFWETPSTQPLFITLGLVDSLRLRTHESYFASRIDPDDE